MKNSSLRKTIRTIRQETGIGWEILEQDYVLSWMLFGISNVSLLKESLIFKGGTALKKCYFGDYRFSQDLDFSVHGKHPKGDVLLSLIDEACRCAAMRMDDIEFKCNRYPEKETHPEEQEAFIIHARPMCIKNSAMKLYWWSINRLKNDADLFLQPQASKIKC